MSFVLMGSIWRLLVCSLSSFLLSYGLSLVLFRRNPVWSCKNLIRCFFETSSLKRNNILFKRLVFEKWGLSLRYMGSKNENIIRVCLQFRAAFRPIYFPLPC